MAARREIARGGGFGLRGGHTLTELMVAVALLVGVLVAVGTLFSTTRRVTGTGAAADDALQDGLALERALRDDLARLAPGGVMVIRCVSVPNDFHGDVLLDPARPADAEIRADQLLFFANGVETVDTLRVGAPVRQRGEGSVARVYWGHAFQLGRASEPVAGAGGALLAIDADEPVMPWTTGPVRLTRTRFPTPPVSSAGTDVFRRTRRSEASLPVVAARKWLLARQAVALVDDDAAERHQNAKTVYLGEIMSARSVFLDDPEIGPSAQVRDGRVDAAATQLNEIRRLIGTAPGGAPRPWRSAVGGARSQYDLITTELLYYPRAERRPPGMHRVDQALTSHVVASACSGFRVEWTYADGTGAVRDRHGIVRRRGVRLAEDPSTPPRSRGRAQPWFGLPDPARFRAGRVVAPDLARGVGAYGDPAHQRLLGEPNYEPAETILPVGGVPNNVERVYTLDGGIVVYEAVFGLNRRFAVDAAGVPDEALGFTPWPTSLRVTARLHDPRGVLETGRAFEFVIDLPPAAAPETVPGDA